MECDRATSQTHNTRTEKNELPNIICKENTYKTADAGDHSENENHNQIFNDRRVHNLPPNYFRNYMHSYLYILIIYGYRQVNYGKIESTRNKSSTLYYLYFNFIF